MRASFFCLVASLSACGQLAPSPDPYNISWEWTEEQLLKEQEENCPFEVMILENSTYVVCGITPFFGSDAPALVSFEDGSMTTVVFLVSEENEQANLPNIYDHAVATLTEQYGVPVSREELNEALRFFSPSKVEGDPYPEVWNPEHLWSLNGVLLSVEKMYDENGDVRDKATQVVFFKSESDGRLFQYMAQLAKLKRQQDSAADTPSSE